ncbi:hypothetical protein RUND412_002387 [Rhizina undulata]
MALLMLGWTKEIVGLFVEDGEFAKNMTIVLAVLSIYLVDFAVNAVQACCRTLIVDTLPAPQQQNGSAWASRMIAVGSIAGYFVGMIDLMGIFGTKLGDTQFKQLIVISAIILVVCVGITCVSVSERVLIKRKEEDEKSGMLEVMGVIWKTVWHLPSGIRAICKVLFWAWIGWFPFMVYSTTFVGEVLKRYDTSMQNSLQTSKDVVGDITRIGSMALVLFSCVSLAASILLPFLVVSPESDTLHKRSLAKGTIATLLEIIEPLKPDLASTWIGCHVLFAFLMFMSLFTSTVRFATLIVAMSGVSWAVMTWAPFAIVGEEISRLSAGGRRRSDGSYDMLAQQDLDLVEMEIARTSIESTHTHVPTELVIVENHATNDIAGVYLGILNVFACIPQFVASFISFVVFSILEPGKSPEFSEGDEIEAPKGGVNAIAVCFGIGGLCTLVAAHYTMKYKNH